MATDTNTKTKSEANRFEALPAPVGRQRAKNAKTTSSGKTNKKTIMLVALLLVVMAVGFAGGWLGAVSRDHQLNIGTAATGKEIVNSQAQLIAAVASNVSSSVVSIDAVAQTAPTQDIFGFTQPGQQEESAGTGIIISSSGYILTCRHVIPQGTTSVSVTLNDGTVINNVQVVGTTPQSSYLDIAFLKIPNPPEALQPATLGDSSKVQIGDNVVAVGNELGNLPNSVSSGIISGIDRALQAGDSTGINENLEDLFQTDAPINPGNSGGPLLNSNGDLIGINVAIAANAQNIGFAMPINDAMGLIKGILASGKVETPYIGVAYDLINPAVAKQYNLSVKSGAFILPASANQNSVASGGPAANAGIQPGDIIQSVNGVKIDNNHSLTSLVDVNTVGSNLSLTVLRGSSTKTINLTVGQAP